jgi:hypothetical protein
MTLADVAAALHLVTRLPRFLRHPLTPERARAALARRLRAREADLLACLDAAGPTSPPGPYRVLLRAAGCEPGDVARLVREHGVEGALERLAKAGVYLTADELKGRQPVVRGSLSFTVDPRTLRNPRGRADVPSRSSGSRGDGTALGIDLAFVRDWSAVLDAQKGERRLIEQEDDDGASALTLIVQPSVGPVDDAAVRETFLAALGTGPSARVMALAWREAGLPRVEQRAPLPARPGKILHLLSGR